jgi:SAM-dependent methyltransferase
VARARYDGLADFYREFRPALPADERNALRRLLGPGPGRCLDVGCGTGLATEALVELGWTAVGVDVSDDMLEVARARGVETVQASGDELPFADASFDAAISVWTHTDVDDFAATVREVARVLRPGSPFVYVGAHPCFIGPHSLVFGGDGVPTLYAGYAEARRYADAPGVANPDGVRARVGAVHLPLGGLFVAFTSAGFAVDHFEELGREDYPLVVALRAFSAEGRSADRPSPLRR